MKYRHAFGGLLLAFALGGCSNLPTPDYVKDSHGDETPPFTVDDLIGHIQCEIRNSLRPELIEDGYVAQVTLTLKVEDNGALTPQLSFINPITSKSSVTYGVNANLSLDRQRTFTTSYTVDLARFDQNPRLDKPEPPADCETHGIYSLSGDLGIAGIVAGGLAAEKYKGVNAPSPSAGDDSDKTPTLPPAKPTAASNAIEPVADAAIAANAASAPPPAAPTFGSTVQFTLVRSANFGPTWSFVHFKGAAGGNGLVAGGRTDTDTLVVAFAPSQNTGSAEAQAEATAALAALNDAKNRWEAAKKARTNFESRNPSVIQTPAGAHPRVGAALTKSYASMTSEYNAAGAEVTKRKNAYDLAVQKRMTRSVAEKAQATSAAQNFTTNMILQNLVGSLPTQ